jgi:flagellar hook-basal body protein
MSFQQALSGLNAASRGLEVIGNNIANANTTGAKASRVEFADVYAASMNAAGSSSMPLGVEIGAVSQSFTQGNITTTNNELDLAINGNGFFQITKTDGTSAYTRSGEFKVDKDGFVVTNNGAKLMGYKTDVDGVRTSTTPSTAAAAQYRPDRAQADQRARRRTQPRCTHPHGHRHHPAVADQHQPDGLRLPGGRSAGEPVVRQDRHPQHLGGLHQQRQRRTHQTGWPGVQHRRQPSRKPWTAAAPVPARPPWTCP